MKHRLCVRVVVVWLQYNVCEIITAATGNRQQATGNRQQATGNRQQATGNRQQATGNRQQATTILYISECVVIRFILLTILRYNTYLASSHPVTKFSLTNHVNLRLLNKVY
jgi:hypothetical protein